MATPPVFVAGAILTAGQLNSAGSWLVKSQDFTTQDPLDLSSIFTSDYVNYKVYLSYYGSTASTLNMQFLTGTATPYTSGNYYRYGYTVSAAGALGNGQYGPDTFMPVSNHSNSVASQTSIEITIFQPNSSVQRKYIYLHFLDPNTGSVVNYSYQIVENAAFTGLRLDPAAGNISGKIRVYGLRD